MHEKEQAIINAIKDYVKAYPRPTDDELDGMDAERADIIDRIYSLADALNEAGYDCEYDTKE